MCGRFTLRAVDRLMAKFDTQNWRGLVKRPDLIPRFNIAPTQDVLTVTESRGERAFAMMVWGMIPSWSSQPSGFINARAETLAQKASFNESFRRRRCLVLADGFYEWRREGKTKQPFFFQLSDESPFAFAGLWDEWRRPDSEAIPGSPESIVTSCTIITTTPNELLAAIHDRMPAILPAEDYGTWLSEDARPDELSGLLAPYPAEAMKSFPVSQQVNHAQIDEPSLVEPVEVKEIAQGSLF
jgi:putative SOS response-associated peptidase YedK